MDILGINREMRKFCNNHKIIKSYRDESFDKLMSQDLDYPLVWFLPQSGTMKNGAIYHEVKLLILELTNKDNSASIESYNNTLLLAQDINTYFYNNSDLLDFDMDIETSFEPIVMDFADNASGCVLTVNFQFRTQRDETEILMD